MADMEMWLGKVKASDDPALTAVAYEPEPLPLSVFLLARDDMPADVVRRHPDLAELDVRLDGFYG